MNFDQSIFSLLAILVIPVNNFFSFSSLEKYNNLYLYPFSGFQTHEIPNTFDCFTVVDVPPSECEGLVAFYVSTNGENWTHNENWLSSTTVSDWYGINVLDGHVTEIYLDNNEVIGPIPPEINKLTYLTNFILGFCGSKGLNSNRITNPLPVEFYFLSNLEYIDFSFTQLPGTLHPEIDNLENLRTLFLFANELSGKIPNEIGNLTHLQKLLLSGNRFSGSIPKEIGNLRELTLLSLYRNNLAGSIPVELGNLTNLTGLFLDSNNLEGTLPSELGNLTNLRQLYLYSNYLYGRIPLSFTQLNSLWDFRFYNTYLCEPNSEDYITWTQSLIFYFPSLICYVGNNFVFFPLINR